MMSVRNCDRSFWAAEYLVTSSLPALLLLLQNFSLLGSCKLVSHSTAHSLEQRGVLDHGLQSAAV